MRRPAPAKALLLAAVVAGCTPARPPAPAPVAARPAPPPPPAPAAVGPDWRDWPLTPGTWAYRQDARGSIALFGATGASAALTLRCDHAARSLYLSRAGTAPAPLTLRTTSLTRLVEVRPTGGTPPYVAAALAPADPLLDAIGFSRGRFVVEQPGAATMVLPAWAEVERVTEDCRDRPSAPRVGARGGRHDPQARVGRIPALFEEEGRDDRQAPQPRHLRHRAAAEKHERDVQYFKRHRAMAAKKWSQVVTEHSDALDLERDVFTLDDPAKIAASLKRSAEASQRRKGTPFQSAMSMLTFYINRAGKGLDTKQVKVLEAAKDELRRAFGKA